MKQIVLGLLLATSVFAADRECGKAVVTGGDSCANLKLNWDLASCDDSAAGARANVRCAGEDAVATLQTEQASYQVKVHAAKGSWDEVVWKAGTVTRHEKARETAVRRPSKKARAERKVAVEPAEQTKPLPREVTSLPPAAVLNPTPAPTTAPEAKPLQFGGYVDAYYAYNFNRPALPATVNGLQPNQTAFRYYDSQHDQLMLNMAELNVHRDAGPVGFRVDIGFGPWSELNAPGDLVSKYVSQAYIEFVPAFLPRLTIDFGKMWTHMGLETAHAEDNFNYSRSYLYGFSMPFWHVGLRAIYQVVPGKLNAGFYVYNGWSINLYDNNTGKTVGGSLVWSPREDLTVVANVISGPELNNDNGTIRTVTDLNTTYNPTPELSFAADIVYGRQSDGITAAKWWGFEGMAKYSFSSLYKLAPRFEYYSDSDGITLGAGPQNIIAFTLTNSFDLGGGFETRLEGRLDHSDRPVFSGARGPALNDQVTAAAALLYKW